jgi:hypothetical protein
MVRQSRGVGDGEITFLLGTELYSEYGHSLVTDLQWSCHQYDDSE